MVSGHVRKLIQEAVEDGVGELDLSHLDLDDLPAEIKDLNYAIVYNERGSFSLSKNRLKLFLSSNLFSTIPMDVFTLHNLSGTTTSKSYHPRLVSFTILSNSQLEATIW
ncbi:hypothetical protein BGZ82_006790 [Podila clonocystis]|nr:hypothetical protein BGZ82_006790 [Podila clonocystis]